MFMTFLRYEFFFFFGSRLVSDVYMCILSNKILICVGNVQVHRHVQAGNEARQDEDPAGDEDLGG